MTNTRNSPNLNRRSLLGAAIIGLAAAQFGGLGPAMAQGARQLPAVKPGAHTSFKPLKTINAGVLNVAYAEDGPADGPVVLLLHGWPYDIYSYVDVAPLLASAGYRVIIPYLRGYGDTRFLSDTTPRNGQPAALATDIIDLIEGRGRRL